MAVYKIAVLKGDGIGPEVVNSALRVLKRLGELSGVSFEFEEGLIGGIAIDQKGEPLPQETLELCLKADAVLLGAVGGPKWDNLPTSKRPEKGLLQIRKALDLYANLRPAKVYEPLISASPLKEEVARGTDFIVIRELTGDVYYGEPRGIFIENRKFFSLLKEDLHKVGKRYEDVPVVIQYNKMDMPNALPFEVLEEKINKDKLPSVCAIAINGEGVVETFELLEGLLISKLERIIG